VYAKRVCYTCFLRKRVCKAGIPTRFLGKRVCKAGIPTRFLGKRVCKAGIQHAYKKSNYLVSLSLHARHSKFSTFFR